MSLPNGECARGSAPDGNLNERADADVMQLDEVRLPA